MAFTHVYRWNFGLSFFYFVAQNIGYMLSILPDHESFETLQNEYKGTEAIDWGEIQVRNSGNFCNDNYGNLFHHLYGGINYQIEHHLFPTLSHVHLPKISPVVK